MAKKLAWIIYPMDLERFIAEKSHRVFDSEQKRIRDDPEETIIAPLDEIRANLSAKGYVKRGDLIDSIEGAIEIWANHQDAK